MIFLVQVCDRPHPALVRTMLLDCGRGNLDAATAAMSKLWEMGYMAPDIVGTMLSDAKRIAIDERLRLDLIKVGQLVPPPPPPLSLFFSLLRCYLCRMHVCM